MTARESAEAFVQKMRESIEGLGDPPDSWKGTDEEPGGWLLVWSNGTHSMRIVHGKLGEFLGAGYYRSFMSRSDEHFSEADFEPGKPGFEKLKEFAAIKENRLMVNE